MKTGMSKNGLFILLIISMPAFCAMVPCVDEEMMVSLFIGQAGPNLEQYIIDDYPYSVSAALIERCDLGVSTWGRRPSDGTILSQSSGSSSSSWAPESSPFIERKLNEQHHQEN